MAAFALARLGISAEAFGQMSLGYYMLLCRELESLDIRHYWPGAAMQATMCNLQRASDDAELATPWDFLPGWEREYTDEEIDAQAEAFCMALDSVIEGTKGKDV